MDLCLADDWRSGPQVSKIWWEQDGLEWEGTPKADWEAEQTKGEEDADGTSPSGGSDGGVGITGGGNLRLPLP